MIKIHEVKKYEIEYGRELPISIDKLNGAVAEYCDLAEIDRDEVVRYGDTDFQTTGEYELDQERLELMVEWLREEGNPFPDRFKIANAIEQILATCVKKDGIVIISIW